MQRRLPVQDLIGALNTGSRPLDGKSFYLDAVKSRPAAVLEEVISQLGGKVESFLHKDVSVVVTGTREHQATAQTSARSPARSGASRDSLLSSPRGSPGSPGGPKHPVCGSRGKALLEKAIRNNEKCHGSVLVNARSWGVKIVMVDDFLAFIDRLTIERSRSKSRKTEKKTSDAPGARVVKAGALKSSYIKVEDCSRRYRPLYAQSLGLPMLSYTGRLSPFEPPASARPGRRRDQEQCRGKPRRSEEPMSSLDKPSAQLPHSPTHRRPGRKSLGYCECCQLAYKDEDEHLLSDRHQRFVQDITNYAVVDQLVTAMEAGFVFSPEPKLDPVLRRLSETDGMAPDSPMLDMAPQTTSETERALQTLLCPSGDPPTASLPPAADWRTLATTTSDPSHTHLILNTDGLSQTTLMDNLRSPCPTLQSLSPYSGPPLLNPSQYNSTKQDSKPNHSTQGVPKPDPAALSTERDLSPHSPKPDHPTLSLKSDLPLSSPSPTAQALGLEQESNLLPRPVICSHGDQAPYLLLEPAAVDGLEEAMAVEVPMEVSSSLHSLPMKLLQVPPSMLSLMSQPCNQSHPQEEGPRPVSCPIAPIQQFQEDSHDDSASVCPGETFVDMLPKELQADEELTRAAMSISTGRAGVEAVTCCSPHFPYHIITVNVRKRSRSFSLSPKPCKRMRTSECHGHWSDPTNESSDVMISPAPPGPISITASICWPSWTNDSVEQPSGTVELCFERQASMDKQTVDGSPLVKTVIPEDQQLHVTECTQEGNLMLTEPSVGPYLKEVLDMDSQTVGIPPPASPELRPPQLYPFYLDEPPLDTDKNLPDFLGPPELFPAVTLLSRPPETSVHPPVSQASNTSLLSHSFSSVCIESALLPDISAYSPTSSESDWDSGLVARLVPSLPLQLTRRRCELDPAVLLQRSYQGIQDGSYESRLCSVLQPPSPHLSLCGEEMEPKPLYHTLETSMDNRLIQRLQV